MPLEKTITNNILKDARKRGWWCYKVAGGAFQISGLPDIHLEKHGRAVWLEVKQPGKKPTKNQVLRMAEIQRVGGSPCHVVTSREQANEWLNVYEEDFSRPKDNQDLGSRRERKLP